MTRFVDGTLDPFLWLLASWSVRWGVLIVALAAWFRARPPRRPASRHLLCATALAAGLVVPLAPRWSAPWPLVSTPIDAPPPVPDPVGPGPDPSVGPRSAEPSRPIDPARVERPDSGPGPLRWLRLGVGAAWLAGAVLVLARLAIGRAVLARLRASARPVSGTALDDCRRVMGSRRRVGLAGHAAIGSPITLGGWSPMILVPEQWDEMPEPERRACLLHELAHLGRLDDLTKLVAELARAPFWFHPAVAWLLARLDREAELACDEAAVGRGVEPRVLAGLLLALARGPRRLDASGLLLGRMTLPFFDRGTVPVRIHRLLEHDMSRTIPASKHATIGLVATLIALALAIGGAGARAIEPAPQNPAPGPAQAAARSFVVAVKDAEGRPVEGAVVVARGHGSAPTRDEARTDAQGLARFAREPMPGMSIKATREGHGLATLPYLDPSKMTGPVALTLPRARSLRGSISDERGRPIAGAEVLVESALAPPTMPRDGSSSSVGEFIISLDAGPLLATRADRDGKFVIEGVPAGKIVMLRVSAEGYASARFAAPEADEPVRAVLVPEARVRGRVVSEVPGVSVADRPVEIWISTGGGNAPMITSQERTTTDAEGRFHAPGLQAGRATVALGGVSSNGPWTFLAAGDVPLVPGSVAEATITIVEGVVVNGRVTSSLDDSPITGVMVSGTRSRGTRASQVPAAAITDAAGDFRLRLAAGDAFDYSAILMPASGRTTSSTDWPTGIVTIPGGVASFTLPTIRLVPPSATSRGRPVDAAGAAPASMSPAERTDRSDKRSSDSRPR